MGEVEMRAGMEDPELDGVVAGCYALEIVKCGMGGVGGHESREGGSWRSAKETYVWNPSRTGLVLGLDSGVCCSSLLRVLPCIRCCSSSPSSQSPSQLQLLHTASTTAYNIPPSHP